MPKNDIILIDSIIQGILENQKCKDVGEAFECLAREQIFKDYDLSEDEIESGWIDGKDDGGIDGIYFFINGQIIVDEKENRYPKNNAELEVYIITCKHSDSFKMDTINALIPTLNEFFDLSKKNEQLDSNYNSDLLEKRNMFFKIYSNVAYALNSLKIKIIYASRGDKESVAENIIARSNELLSNINKMFSNCYTDIIFCGSKEIIEMYRKKPRLFSELKYKEVISQDNSYLILTTLNDYYNFIIDENKKLKRYFLDSNVRSYMGINRVNEDIYNTLKNDKATDFWFLNNGITMLSTKVTIIGKQINVENVQIINGLQTTETLYNYFNKNEEIDNRNILIKIIVSEEKELRDNIIKASNNQTVIEVSALHATDKIQRDIEDLLLKNDIYYERRTNFYVNQGIQKEKLCTPLYLAIGYVSLILKIPYKAVSLKQKFMNKPSQYGLVFSEKNDIECYSNIIKIMKNTDKILEKNRASNPNSTEKYLKSLRPIVAFITLSKIFKKFNFNENDIKKLDLKLFSEKNIQETLDEIKECKDNWYQYNNWRKKDYSISICEEIAKKHNINDIDTISNRKNPFSTPRKMYDISEEFIEKVKNELPLQPWTVGIHTKIAKKLNEETPKVSQAINTLIERGIYYRQKNGILYDKNKNVVKYNN